MKVQVSWMVYKQEDGQVRAFFSLVCCDALDDPVLAVPPQWRRDSCGRRIAKAGSLFTDSGHREVRNNQPKEELM